MDLYCNAIPKAGCFIFSEVYLAPGSGCSRARCQDQLGSGEDLILDGFTIAGLPA